MATTTEHHVPTHVRRVIRKRRAALPVVFDLVNYYPHKGQRRIHASNARHRVVDAGRRTGKSTLGGHELTAEALATRLVSQDLKDLGKRREFWIVGPEYSDSEKEFRVLYNDLSKLEVPFDRPGTYNNPESGDMHISLWGGTFEVHAKSAKYPQTLVGEGLSGVIMAEAAKLKERVWTKYVRPTLADFRGWSIHSSTPEGKNWFYRMWQRGQDPNDPSWDSFKMPSWINDLVFPKGATPEGIDMLLAALRGNPTELRDAYGIGDPSVLMNRIVKEGLVDEEIIDMARDMSEERFQQEIGAEFTEFVGRVFKEFDEEVHVKSLNYDPRYSLYACCDYGWTNPFVLLFVQVDVWDNVYVLAEYRQVRRDINDIAKDLESYPISGQVKTLFPDPAEPGDTAVLEKHLRWKANTGTGGELKWRLELIRQFLKVDPHTKSPRLFIDRSCVDLIREMQDYRYPETKEEQSATQPERPMDKDDHGPEALGRFFRGHFGGPGDSSGGRVVVRKAKMNR